MMWQKCLPFLSILLLCYFVVVPQQTIDHVPSLFCGLWQSNDVRQLNHQPKQEETRVLLFDNIENVGDVFLRIGRIHALWMLNQTNEALKDEAAKALQWKTNLTDAQMRSLYDDSFKFVHNQGVLAMVYGAMTLTRILWFVFGCILFFTGLRTFGHLLIIPLQWLAQLLQRMGPTLYRIAMIVGEWIEKHQKLVMGVIEVSSYVFSMWFITEGGRYSPQTGMFISFMGGLMLLGCMMFSKAAHEWENSNPFIAPCLIFGLLAVLYQNMSLALIAIACLYKVLGMVFESIGFGYVVGFRTEKHIQQMLLVSLVLFSTVASFRPLLESFRWPRPFVYPIFTFSPIVYFLGMLIQSSKSWEGTNWPWERAQIQMVLSLIVGLIVSCLFHITPLLFVTCVFGVLYVMDKMLETEMFEKLYVRMFFVSLIGFMGCFYISTHNIVLWDVLEWNGSVVN